MKLDGVILEGEKELLKNIKGLLKEFKKNFEIEKIECWEEKDEDSVEYTKIEIYPKYKQRSPRCTQEYIIKIPEDSTGVQYRPKEGVIQFENKGELYYVKYNEYYAK